MPTFTDAEVFGQAPSGGGGVLSDAEVFGTKAPSPRQPRSEASIALGGVGAAGKAVARSVADFGDMLLSVPGMAMGSAADVASRIQSLVEGNDSRTAGRISKEVREGVTSTFSPPVLRQLTEAAIHAVAPDKKKLDDSDIQKGMRVISEGLERGGKWVEQKTKGLITAETFDSLVNEGMALGGLRGGGALARRMTPSERPPNIPPPSPAAEMAKRDVKADVEAATGVPRQGVKELKKAAVARRQDARAAFKEDPEYADYLRNYAEEEAKMREQIAPVPNPISPLAPDNLLYPALSFKRSELSAPGGRAYTGPRTPRTGLRDAVVPKEPTTPAQPLIVPPEPTALETALAKTKEGRPSFDYTSEERIALNGFRSTWNRPNIMKGEKGAARPDLMQMIAGLGVGTGLALYAYYNKDDRPMTLGAAVGALGLGGRSALGRIEVPPQPRGPTRMLGRASTADMAALAAFVGGALAAQAWADDPSLVKSVVSGLMGAGATTFRPRMLSRVIQDARSSAAATSVAVAANLRERSMRLAGIDIANTVRDGAKLVKDEKELEAVTTALDTGKFDKLNAGQRALASKLRSEFERLGRLGLEAGVLENTRSDYITHIVRPNPKLAEYLAARKGYGTSPHTPYSLKRGFPTIEELEKAGFELVTKNPLAIYATYAHSLVAAAANAQLLKTLKTLKTEGGDLVLQKASEAPPSYVKIENPQLQGVRVHPEIASKMSFMFENPSSTGYAAMLETVADVSKRSAVFGSAFHVKALVDALAGARRPTKGQLAGAAGGAALGYLGATALGDEHTGREAALGGVIGLVGRRFDGFSASRNKYLQDLQKNGSTSPYVKRAVMSGLVFGNERGHLVVDDAGRKFYDAMTKVQEVADRISSPVGIKTGKGVEAYVRANHEIDAALWGRLHPAWKLEVWGKTAEELRENSIKRHEADKNSRVLSQGEADEIAASFTNDTFGGLDWTGIAMNARTRIGRMVAEATLSPRGRRVMRVALFAPDWTLSTARAALSAVDRDLVNPLKWGDVARGAFRPITRGDLARQYVMRSALYYMVVGDAINYAMSGHHLWENDEKIGWDFIDWGDGRRAQFSKHIMETYHWFKKPVEQGVSKLGYVPKETANQVFGTEYLAPKQGKSGQVFLGPKMKDPSALGRVEHAAKGFEPIPAQSRDLEAFAWGELGMPLFGMTREQREETKRERDEKKRRERR